MCLEVLLVVTPRIVGDAVAVVDLQGAPLHVGRADVARILILESPPIIPTTAAIVVTLRAWKVGLQVALDLVGLRLNLLAFRL